MALNQLFHCPTAVNSAMTDTTGRDSGRTIWVKKRVWLHPSRKAASTRDSGILLWIKVRTMMILRTPTQPSRKTMAGLLARPRDFTVRYVGISPPLKNMVIIM